VRDPRQAFVFVLGVELQDVVTGEVVLDEAPKVVLVASGRSDDELGVV